MKQKMVNLTLLLIIFMMLVFKVNRYYATKQIEDAILRGDIQAVHRLSQGKDVGHWRGTEGNSLLCSALNSRTPDSALNMFHSAEDLASCGSPETLFEHVLPQGSDELVKKLIPCLRGNASSPLFLEHALFAATRAGRPGIVKALLSEKAPVNTHDKNGNPIVIAAIAQYYHPVAVRKQILELLIDSGAAVDARDRNEKTALHYCALQGENELVSVLVKYGANLDAVCPKEHDSTPLLHAVVGKHTETVHLILKLGANPNIPPSFQRIALTYAVQAQSPSMVNVLLHAQKSPFMASEELLTQACRLPTSREKEAIVALLKTGQK